MHNQSALVLGLGKSGKEAALLLREKGAKVQVAELEENSSTLRRKKQLENYGVQVVFGAHNDSLLNKKDLVITSPGVSNQLSIIKKAQFLNIPVISELEFASRFIPREDIIAITGTNGKTTTTFLAYQILKRGGLKVKIGGNIGIPLSRVVRTSLSQTNFSYKVVTEVSSFQLELTNTFSPHIYCILNIYLDHLDRHPSFLEYQKIKAIPLLRMRQNDFVFLNYDHHLVRSLSEVTKAKLIFFSQRQKLREGIFIDKSSIVANLGGQKIDVPLGNLQIHRFHSWENVLCAIGIALLQGVNVEVIRDSLIKYKPLPHRQQLIGKIAGVTFVDDSKATNQAAVKNLINSLTSFAILIMGGRDKGGSFSELKEYLPKKVKSLVLIGEAKKKIKKELKGTVPIEECNSLKKAIKVAFSLSKRGELIVLCPGCSSFDQFTSYRHRGRVFKKEVEKLREEIEGKNSI